MPPFAFAPVTILNVRAKGAPERPARRAALVIPGIESGGRGAIRLRHSFVAAALSKECML